MHTAQHLVGYQEIGRGKMRRNGIACAWELHIGKMSRFVIDALGLFNNRARFNKLNNVSFAFTLYALV